MKRLTLLFLLLLLWFPICHAQRSMWWAATKRPATAVASGFYPTNTPDGSWTNLISWWRATDYYTNGSIATLPDLWTNSYILTNSGAAGTRPTTNGTWMIFDGSDDYLKNTAYTSAQPHEILMVFYDSVVSNSASAWFYYDSANSTYRNAFLRGGSQRQNELYCTADAYFMYPLTNRWITVDAIFNGTDCSVATNTVSAAGGLNAGVKGMQGFTLGANNGLSIYGAFRVSEMMTWRATNDLTRKSNIFYYVTNLSAACTNLGIK